jgi:maleamate amidohydrolase
MKTAIMILDIQKDFVGEQARMPVAKHQINPMLQNINKVIEKANKLNMPIIYIGNEFTRTQFIANWFRNQAALKGESGTELDERLLVVNDIYFPKKQGDAFSNSHLIDYMNTSGIQHLVISGLFAEGCVSDTAKSAVRRGFNVTVLQDTVAGATDAKREKALLKLRKYGISIKNSDELLKDLTNKTS